mmetsp:Transcript_47187/g.115283  ORF Transcript_47187/g.115283 Transcript_47187/m.115283 type:complete len:417 (-) Transcript_47187:215-1465(-)
MDQDRQQQQQHPSSPGRPSSGTLWTSSSSSSTVSSFSRSPARTTTRLQQLQSHTEKLKSKVQTKLKSDDVQKKKQQAGKALKHFGSQLNQKFNLGKLIDQMESDQGLADSLEQLNDRMKDEVERQEVRREAEQLGLKVIQDHLDETLTKNPECTYEEWIQDLHPENANMGRLLDDIQEIDARFYVFQSDHRRLWNEAMTKLEKEESSSTANVRRIEPRTTKWGDEIPDISNVDLLSGPTSAEFHAAAAAAATAAGSGGGGGGGYRDSFSPAVLDDTVDGNDDRGSGFVDVDILNMKDDDTQSPSTTTTADIPTTATTTTTQTSDDPFIPSSSLPSQYQAAGSYDVKTTSTIMSGVDPFAPVSATTATNTTTESSVLSSGAATSTSTSAANAFAASGVNNSTTTTDGDADHGDLLKF